MTHDQCIALMIYFPIGEFILGAQNWCRAKSHIALIAIIVSFIFALVISLAVKTTKGILHAISESV